MQLLEASRCVDLSSACYQHALDSSKLEMGASRRRCEPSLLKTLRHLRWCTPSTRTEHQHVQNHKICAATCNKACDITYEVWERRYVRLGPASARHVSAVILASLGISVHEFTLPAAASLPSLRKAQLLVAENWLPLCIISTSVFQENPTAQPLHDPEVNGIQTQLSLHLWMHL